MLVGEPSPAPRVVAGLRKLRPELSPAPVPTPTDPNLRISGVLRQYFSSAELEFTWVRAAVRGGCLLAWRDGTLPRRPAARLPLRHLHLRACASLPNAFQLSRLRDDAAVATFQRVARFDRVYEWEPLAAAPCPGGRLRGPRLTLRHLHLRACARLTNAFQLSRVRDDAAVATFQVRVR
ncbi:unnamed protein product [Plutella xylostella]|uniref:(diamondback moth) hypothetical protein n=1 Tax=Plutella xylostella TaxID=51655 RepID=A0A8S4E8Y3_PLUXY|nr:unnamed protein product [Plutella xylostella]